MAVDEMQSAAVTKGKSTHHASERSEAYVKRPLSTFQPGMPVEQDFAGKQKADVDVLGSASVAGARYLRACAITPDTERRGSKIQHWLALLSVTTDLRETVMTLTSNRR